ncbi:MAG: FAD-binding oxidoreductase, partial [Proteobacteria bacterium]|nr:FAD-binding oxidoreductase [Pseudomonadota bacterium]
RVPVTVRGAGTGNYGQAMPLNGGVVLDLSKLNRIKSIEPGRFRAESGAKLSDIDIRCQTESQQELRMHPSTWRTATIGGFVCGGSGGVGSVTWGGLRDRGSVIGLRVVTMETAPRVLELRGDDVQKVVHAYGTTGVVTEVEMPLAPAHPWVELVAGFDDFATAARFSHALAGQDALLKKLVTAIAAPIPQLYFRQLKGIVPEGRHVALLMIAELAIESFEALCRDWRCEILYRSDRGARPGMPPIYEFTWNHSTLQALKVDRAITYHQSVYPAPDPLGRVARVHARLGGDVMPHLEFVRFDGGIGCFGLPLIRFTGDARLAEIEAVFEAEGCPLFSPHACTLEEGGMKKVDPVQLAFKRETDPQGLLNPGKMIAWERPDYDGSRQKLHLFPAAGAGG